jgi:hypothetical protein
MSNYTKFTNFTVKDSLASGNPSKVIKGAEFDTEFDAIAAAIATKADTTAFDATNASNLTTGLVAVAVGGTNSTSIPVAGAVPYGTGSAYAFTDPPTAANQVLTSTGTNTEPIWVDPNSLITGGGGGGGGSSTSARTVTPPVLSNMTGTTEAVVTRWTIPANFLVAGDALKFSTFGLGVNNTSIACTVRIRVGTTGTTSDTVVWSDTYDLSPSSTTASMYSDHILYTNSIGTSGQLGVGGAIFVGVFGTSTLNFTSSYSTLDTTVPLYISITFQPASGSTTGFTPRGAFLSVASHA